MAEEPPWRLQYQAAVHVMAAPVAGLDAVVRVSEVCALLAGTTHNSFPVHTARDASTGLGRLDGVIQRSQLLLLLKHRAFCDAEGRYQGVPSAAAPALEQRLSLLMQERSRRSASGRLLLVYDGSASAGPSPLRSPARLTPRRRSASSANLGLPWEHSSTWHSYAQPVQAAEQLPGPGQAAAAARGSLLDERQGQRSPGAGQLVGEGAPDGEEASPLYLNLLPFMNRAPLSGGAHPACLQLPALSACGAASVSARLLQGLLSCPGLWPVSPLRATIPR